MNICLCDWDGTLREGYLIFDWADFLISRQIVNWKNEDLLRAHYKSFASGQISYEEGVVLAANAYAELIRDVEVERLENAASEFVESDRKLMPFAHDLLSTIKSRNTDIVIVSGAPSIVLSAYSEKLQIDRIYGVTIAQSISGEIEVKTHGTKRDKRIATSAELGPVSSALIAIGDTTSDMPLFERSEIVCLVKNDSNSKEFGELASSISNRSDIFELSAASSHIDSLDTILEAHFDRQRVSDPPQLPN